MAAVDVIVLLSDDEVEDAAPVAAAPAAPAAPPAPAAALLSRKKRRLALAQPEPAVPALGAAAVSSAAGASGAAEDVIDLTADEDAFASAWRDFEVIDLSGDDEVPAQGQPQRDAKPTPPPIDDVLSRQRAKIRAFLRQKGASLRVEACEPNPHAAPGTPLYGRFAAALRRCADKRVQLVFHGTAEANIDAICREGLDPKRRAGQAMGPGEYFGKDAMTSFGYCRGGKKMLIFAVISDRSGITADNAAVLVVHRPEHHLPLFVLTFSGGPTVGMPYVPPANHVLRRAAPTLPDAPPRRCAACAAPLSRSELALGRTGTDAVGAAKLDLHHLRCAAKAPWAFQASLQPMLREYARRAQRGAPPLTDRELAVIYEEFGSDERRAAPLPQPAAGPAAA